MSALNAALDDYLKLRRALGFKFKDPEIRLRRFVSFMEERQATLISTQLALEWARLPNSHPSNWATRLRMVRAFARHCRQFDERHEVPPAGLLTGQPARATPYLYTITEIKALMNFGARQSEPTITQQNESSLMTGLRARWEAARRECKAERCSVPCEDTGA
jgi:hypothetical protein